MLLKQHATTGEKYRPAMQITDPKKAKLYFEKLVQHNLANSTHTREEAENIERGNLGYIAGYYDNATRLRVEKLFSCAHPIFGKAGKEPVTPEAALAAGMAMGAAARAKPKD